MTEEELIQLTETLPNRFIYIKYVHDNLPTEKRNAHTITDFFNTVNGFGIDIETLLETFKQTR